MFRLNPSRFEDFDIDQFVDYLQNNEEIVNNHESPKNSVVNGHHPVDGSNNSRQSESPDDTKSFGNDSMKETFFYTCTVCHEVVESGRDLLKHVRTHTRLRNTDKFSRTSSNSKVSVVYM